MSRDSFLTETETEINMVPWMSCFEMFISLKIIYKIIYIIVF